MQYITKLLDRITTTSHINQSTHYGAYHIAQKAVGANRKNQQIFVPLGSAPLSRNHAADVCFVV